MNIRDFAECRGLGPQLLVGVDSKSDPEKIICHFVRMETIAFDNNGLFNETKFAMIGADNEPRLQLVIESILRGISGAPES